MPEAAVEEVEYGVFSAAHVEVHRRPVVNLVLRGKNPGVAGVQVAQIVPAGARPLGHGVGLPPGRTAAARADGIHPIADTGQGRFTGARGGVGADLGQGEGQFALRQGHDGGALFGLAMIAVYHGDGFAPVALAAEYPIPQLVVHRLPARAPLFEPGGDAPLRLRGGQAVKGPRIHRIAFRRGTFSRFVGGGAADSAPHDLNDGQIERLGKVPVPLVVGGNRHDRACAVGDKHIIGDPDGNLRAVHGVEGVRAAPYAGLLLSKIGALQVAFAGRFLQIRGNRHLLFRRGDLLHQGMFRGQHHVGCPEKGIGPGGVNLQRLRVSVYLERNVCAFGAAYPVPLHELDRLRPVQAVQVREEALGIGGDLQNPLADALTGNGGSAAFTLAVLHFLIGQARLAGGAPVNGALRFIGQALFEEFEEYPLGPAVVIPAGGVHFPVPVVGEAQGLDLGAELADVRRSGERGVCAGLDGVILRREAECVEAHGVQHVESPHAEVTGVDVRGGIAFGVAHVESLGGGVREHIQHIAAFFLGN